MDFTKGYIPTDRVRAELAGIKPLFIVGPTGSGKDTVQNKLLKSGSFYKIVTYTTRLPRLNHGVVEREGEDYHFINTLAAKEMAKDQKFIEITLTHGYIYATSIEDFISAKNESKIPMLDIDVKGVASFNNLSSNFIAVFLLPISFSVMYKRLLSRYGSSADEQDINKRLKTALSELKELLREDYFMVIINKDIDDTVRSVIDISSGEYKSATFSAEARDLTKKIISDIEAHLSS